MADDLVLLERKTQETEAMKQRVAEMEEVKALMEKQVQDYAIYEVKCRTHNPNKMYFSIILETSCLKTIFNIFTYLLLFAFYSF